MIAVVAATAHVTTRVWIGMNDGVAGGRAGDENLFDGP
jgi:hypothetical protein